MGRAHARSIAALAIARGPSSLLPNRPAATGLPTEQKQKFESRLGADFSRVRVHCDAVAAAAADALGAKAFAVGTDLFFGANRWQPYTQEGSTLLAHELVHVAQQGRAGGAAHRDAEQRADAAAEQVRQGDSVGASTQGAADAGVYCDDDDSKLKPDERAPLPSFGFVPPGLSLLSPPPPAGSMPGFVLPPLRLGAAPPGGASLSFGLPPLQLPALPPMQLPVGPGLAPSSPALSPYAQTPIFPPWGPAPTTPASGLNRADILGLFGAHGMAPGSLGIDINADYAQAYQQFSYLPEFARVWSANHFLSGAYSADLARDHPNIFDRSNAEFAAAYPDEWHTPIIPIISPDTLPYILKGLDYTGRGIGAGFQFVGDGISRLIGGKK